MLKAVFTDMDDTLIINQVLYDHAIAMMTGYLVHFGVTPKEVTDVFKKIDKDLFPSLGYSRERMPKGFELTLLHFAPNADAEMIKTVRDFAETIFSTVADPKPDIEEALDLLSGKYPLYIITQGDKGVQEERVRNFPFSDRFSAVYIVDLKSPETFAKIVSELGYTPEETVMIGDSLKSDIHTSTAAGMKAVWIEAPNAHLEAASKILPPNAVKFSSFMEAARHIVEEGDVFPRPPVQPKPAAPKP